MERLVLDDLLPGAEFHVIFGSNNELSGIRFALHLVKEVFKGKEEERRRLKIVHCGLEDELEWKLRGMNYGELPRGNFIDALVIALIKKDNDKWCLEDGVFRKGHKVYFSGGGYCLGLMPLVHSIFLPIFLTEKHNSPCSRDTRTRGIFNLNILF